MLCALIAYEHRRHVRKHSLLTKQTKFRLCSHYILYLHFKVQQQQDCRMYRVYSVFIIRMPFSLLQLIDSYIKTTFLNAQLIKKRNTVRQEDQMYIVFLLMLVTTFIEYLIFSFKMYLFQY